MHHRTAPSPRAFKNARALARHDDILILTWSVDYWDYLAEADPLAMPESTERQKAYVDRFDLRGPYTPQTVFDGALQCAGTKRSKMERWINSRLDAPASNITVEAGDGNVTIGGDMGLPKDVILVHYLDDHEGDAPNPVIKSERIGVWSGGETAYPVSCQKACAVLVQGDGTGEIYAAKVMP